MTTFGAGRVESGQLVKDSKRSVATIHLQKTGSGEKTTSDGTVGDGSRGSEAGGAAGSAGSG